MSEFLFVGFFVLGLLVFLIILALGVGALSFIVWRLFFTPSVRRARKARKARREIRLREQKQIDDVQRWVREL